MSAVDEFGFLRFRATAWWSWSDSNQPPKCYGTWFESDQLPWSDTHPDRRAFVVSAIILAAGRTRTSSQSFRKAVRVRPARHVGLTLPQRPSVRKRHSIGLATDICTAANWMFIRSLRRRVDARYRALGGRAPWRS